VTTKHTPATPLPWHTEYAVNIVCSDGHEYDDREIGAAFKNASYLAHAANAYPRLVEDLQACVTQNADFEHMTDECAAAFRAARALLRELEEAA
jgi:hypothetical protein